MTVPLSRASIPRLGACALLALAAALSAPTVQAAKNASLYKCVDLAGVTSIQSRPCPPGSLEAWRRDAPVEPVPTPDQRANAEAKRLRDQQAVRELSDIVDKKLQAASGAAVATPAPASATAPSATDADVASTPASTEAASVAACQKAQAFAASVREQAWLALSEEQMRRLYGWVAEQCKLPPAAN